MHTNPRLNTSYLVCREERSDSTGVISALHVASVLSVGEFPVDVFNMVCWYSKDNKFC